jgi:hypothetical protein
MTTKQHKQKKREQRRKHENPKEIDNIEKKIDVIQYGTTDKWKIEWLKKKKEDKIFQDEMVIPR